MIYTLVGIIGELIISFVEIIRGNPDRAIYFLLLGLYVMEFNKFVRERMK